MTIIYSKTSGGFFDPTMRAAHEAHGSWPLDGVEISDEQHQALLAAQRAGKIIQADADGAPVAVDPPVEPLANLKARLATDVDNQVAAIYEKFTRFETEYTAREGAARAFKAASYVGDAGTWVTAFATAAGKTPKDAADLIIAQADAMRAALPALGALRMRKYEIAAAASAANAKAIHDDILSRAAAAAAGL